MLMSNAEKNVFPPDTNTHGLTGERIFLRYSRTHKDNRRILHGSSDGGRHRLGSACENFRLSWVRRENRFLRSYAPSEPHGEEEEGFF